MAVKNRKTSIYGVIRRRDELMSVFLKAALLDNGITYKKAVKISNTVLTECNSRYLLDLRKFDRKLYEKLFNKISL